MKKCLFLLVGLLMCCSLAAQEEDGSYHAYTSANPEYDPIDRDEPYIEIFWWRHAAHRDGGDSAAVMWKWSGGPCVAAWIDGPDGMNAQRLSLRCFDWNTGEETYVENPDFVPFTPDSPNQQMRDLSPQSSGGGFTMVDPKRDWESLGVNQAYAMVNIEVVDQIGEVWAPMFEPDFNMATPYILLDPNQSSNARYSPTGKMLIEVADIRWCVPGWLATRKWAMFFQVKDTEGNWQYWTTAGPVVIPFENYEGSAEGWTLRENLLLEQNESLPGQIGVPRWPNVIEIRVVVVDWPGIGANPDDCVIIYESPDHMNIHIPKLD